MDWLGAQAIHQSRLLADRLAEDQRSKRLDLQAASMKRKAEIENEVIDHAIEIKTKIEEAQLNEDEKEQLQQDLDALQPTPEEEDVHPIDEDLLGAAIFHQLSDANKEILRALAQLDDGLGIVALSDDDPIWARLEIIDPESHRAVCHLTLNVPKMKSDLASLEQHKLVTIRDPNLYKITKLGRKAASLSKAE